MDQYSFYKELEELYAKDGKAWRIMMLVLAAIFGAYTVYAFSINDVDSVAYLSLAATLVCLGVFYFYQRRRNIDNIPAYREIKAGNVVWIYPENISSKGITSYNVKIKSRNGKLYRIPTSQYITQQEYLQKLHALFPDALIGYDKETKQAAKNL